MNSVELRSQLKEHAEADKAWLKQAEADGLPDGEVSQEWSRRMSDFDALAAEANKAERREQLERVESDLSRPSQRKTGPVNGAKAERSLTKFERNQALKSWLAYGSAAKVRKDEKTVSDAEAMGLRLENPNAEARGIGTQTVSGSTTQAALTAQPNALYGNISPNVQIELKYYSDIINSVTQINTSDGYDLVLPRISDVSRTVAIVGEGADSPEGPDPTIDRITLKGYYFRQLVLASYEMLQDARFDLEGFISQALSDGMGRTVEQYLCTGTGSSQPQGFVPGTDASQVSTLAAGKKSVDTFDQLMTLVALVEPAYRNNCKFVFNDTSVFDIRRIKDSQNRYIWDVNTATNGPVDRILGYPFIVSNSVDASNAFSKKLVWFGDLSREVMRVIDGLHIVRLNELYARRNMVGFHVMMRWDSKWTGFVKSSALIATPAS